MIVRKLEDGSLVLVNQTDHARLSGFFGAHWGNETFERPHRQTSLIRAAIFHDSGWARYELAPHYSVERQIPIAFFEVPNNEEQLSEFQRAIEWLVALDPYAGLLVSRHRTGLWQERYGTVRRPTTRVRARVETAIDEFIKRQEERQIDLQNVCRISDREMRFDYQILQFLDIFSLAFCTKDFGDCEFEPVPTKRHGEGSGGVRVGMRLVGDHVVAVEPYPFDRSDLEFGYLYRHLATSAFATVDEFRQAYFEAPVRFKTYTFVKDRP